MSITDSNLAQTYTSEYCHHVKWHREIPLHVSTAIQPSLRKHICYYSPLPVPLTVLGSPVIICWFSSHGMRTNVTYYYFFREACIFVCVRFKMLLSSNSLTDLFWGRMRFCPLTCTKNVRAYAKSETKSADVCMAFADLCFDNIACPHYQASQTATCFF